MTTLTKDGITIIVARADVEFYVRLGYVVVDSAKVNPISKVVEPEIQRPSGRKKKEAANVK